MRKKSTIKDIELFLNRLKHYLVNSMDRSVNAYLSSSELINRHQILLLNKCEAINRGISLSEVINSKELSYDSKETDSPDGLKEIDGLMNDIGNN